MKPKAGISPGVRISWSHLPTPQVQLVGFSNILMLWHTYTLAVFLLTFALICCHCRSPVVFAVAFLSLKTQESKN